MLPVLLFSHRIRKQSFSCEESRGSGLKIERENKAGLTLRRKKERKKKGGGGRLMSVQCWLRRRLQEKKNRERNYRCEGEVRAQIREKVTANPGPGFTFNLFAFADTILFVCRMIF